MHCLHSASKETVTWLGPGAPPEPRCRQDTSGCPAEYIGHRQSMVFPKQKWGAIPRRWQHTRLSLLETSSRRCPGLWAAGSPPSRPRSTCTLPRPSPKAPHSLLQGIKKPYNPILGETFRCCWAHPQTNSRTFYIAEQARAPCPAQNGPGLCGRQGAVGKGGSGRRACFSVAPGLTAAGWDSPRIQP